LRLHIDGPDVLLPAKVVTQMALILHELATNALKHGAWSGRDHGLVSIKWREKNGEQLEFEWREHGSDGVPKPIREGFGSKLIKSGVGEGRVSHEIKPDGAHCQIELQL
jgi:two-component sensor histidine kinase